MFSIILTLARLSDTPIFASIIHDRYNMGEPISMVLSQEEE